MDPFKELLRPLAMPWEVGWGRALIGDGALPSDIRSLETAQVSRNEAGPATSATRSLDLAKKRVSERHQDPEPGTTHDVNQEEKDQAERALLLDELQDWLIGDGAWSKLGGILVETTSREERDQIMQDAFAERSTGTLRLRTQALRLFSRWRGRVVPYDEGLAYSYMSHLRRTNAPPSRAKSFLEAALLLAAVANSDDLTGIANSSRLRGAAYSMIEHKKLRRQRDPLTLKQVRALEELVVKKDSVQEAAVLGQCLFALHSCARWSDLLALAEEPQLDEAVVTVNSKRTKTSRGLKKLRIPIPFVAIRHGVSGQDWASSWLSARKASGLQQDPSVKKMLTSASFGADQMDSTTASRHLRAFLIEAGCPPSPKQNLGTHSLKATLLSWAARWSMKASSRRILGKHSDRKDHSMLTYSRDVCIAALKDVALMFLDIKEGKFDPDATRSIIVTSISYSRENREENAEGNVTEDDQNDADLAAPTQEVEVENFDDKSTRAQATESDSSTSEDDFCSDGEEVDMLNMDIEDEKKECALGDYLVNPKSGCAHVALDRGYLTACGVVGLGFAVHTSWDSAAAVCESFCKKCRP